MFDVFASRYAWATPEVFVELTPRQVFGLLNVIQKSKTVEWYEQLLAYATVHRVKIPSIDEFLDLSLKEKPIEKLQFDEKADKALEAHALKRLEEMRANGGQ